MVGYGLVNTSIVCCYRRIFVTRKRSVFDISTKITIIVIFLWTIVFVLMVTFACGSEFEANWGSHSQTSVEGLAGSNHILDVALLVLPLPVLGGPVTPRLPLFKASPDLATSYKQYPKSSFDGHIHARFIVSEI